jgi:hypothetical protein
MDRDSLNLFVRAGHRAFHICDGQEGLRLKTAQSGNAALKSCAASGVARD